MNFVEVEVRSQFTTLVNLVMRLLRINNNSSSKKNSSSNRYYRNSKKLAIRYLFWMRQNNLENQMISKTITECPLMKAFAKSKVLPCQMIQIIIRYSSYPQFKRNYLLSLPLKILLRFTIPFNQLCRAWKYATQRKIMIIVQKRKNLRAMSNKGQQILVLGNLLPRKTAQLIINARSVKISVVN